MAGVVEHATQPADWSAALQQVFAEPWRVRPAFQPILDLERKQVPSMAASVTCAGGPFGE